MSNNLSKSKRVAHLISEIRKHNRLYYEHGKPEISDFDYDQLKLKLQKLRPSAPILKLVGYTPLKKEGVLHSREEPMGSLTNVRTLDELETWVTKYHWLKNSVLRTPKVDGLSIEIVYNEREFMGAYTRGDGNIGVDVSLVISQLPEVPKFIIQSGLWVIRGEAVITFNDFREMNRKAEEQGIEPYTLPRSAAVGLINSGLAAPEHSPKTKLKFLAWELHRGNPKITNELKTERACLQYMRDHMDIPVVPYGLYAVSGIEEDTFAEWNEWRKALEYPTDGVVLSFNDLSALRRLGKSGMNPRGKVAFKFPPTRKNTVVTQVVNQIGRTGQLCPVILFKNVILDGADVHKASGHNYNEMLRKGIRIGRTVCVEKAGEIIPQVVKTVDGKNDKEFPSLSVPTNCPECNSVLVKEGEHLFCKNITCPCRIELRLVNYCKIMGMLGFGVKTIQKLKPAIKNIWDLYSLPDSKLPVLLGSRIMAKKLQNEINNSRNNVPFPRLLEALGISRVGKEMAKKVASCFKNVEELTDCCNEETIRLYLVVGGIRGYDAITSIPKELIRHREELIWLSKCISVTYGKKRTGTLSGKTFCITGTLDGGTREEYAKRIEQKGGVFSDTLTKKCDYLLVGESGGKKQEKANKLRVRCINEGLFEQLCNGEKE